jgi:ankyrin repeat protein
MKFAIAFGILAALVALVILAQPGPKDKTAPAPEILTVDRFIFIARNGTPEQLQRALGETERMAIDLNKPDHIGRTALTEALLNGMDANANLLLDAGAGATLAGRQGYTPLILAGNNGDPALVQRLLAAGANPRRANDAGVTALHTAGRSTAENEPLTQIVGALLQAGADPNAADNDGYTPLMVCASRGRVDPMLLLINAGADVNARNNAGLSAIAYAVMSGDFSSRAAWEIDLSQPGEDAARRLGFLALALDQTDSLGAVRLLLNRGADINTQDNYSTSPIMRAAGLGNIDRYRQIIADAGGDPDLPDAQARLKELVRAAHADQIVLALRNADAYVNLPNSIGADAMTVSRDRTDPVGKLIHGLLLEGKRVTQDDVTPRTPEPGDDSEN